MNHLVYWVWLSLRCGAGSELGSYLLKHFETPKDIYEATREELLSLKGMNESIVEALMDRSLTLPKKIVEYCERVNVGILTLESANYPERLRGIHAKPIVLYYRGKLPNIDDNVLIACVGMRACSEGGAQNAYRLGMDLAAAGAIVVSGMASGIDTAVQSGVLAAGGHTIAVLGCGIDRVYPTQNADLMNRIAKTGTLITEYAPGTEPRGQNFPIRNRIISGLCQGTVVVEANAKSGSLITASYAEKQGRDIFAFPGSAESSNAKGTNALIQKGAKFVVCAEDILEEYELLYPDRIFTENIVMRKHRQRSSDYKFVPTETKKNDSDEESVRSALKKTRRQEKSQNKVKRYAEPAEATAPAAEKPANRAQDCESALGREILSVMKGSMSADEIAAALSEKTGVSCDMGEFLGCLTILEIEGFVCALPGGNYRLA